MKSLKGTHLVGVGTWKVPCLMQPDDRCNQHYPHNTTSAFPNSYITPAMEKTRQDRHEKKCNFLLRFEDFFWPQKLDDDWVEKWFGEDYLAHGEDKADATDGDVSKEVAWGRVVVDACLRDEAHQGRNGQGDDGACVWQHSFQWIDLFVLKKIMLENLKFSPVIVGSRWLLFSIG